jgi:hypothetical protein
MALSTASRKTKSREEAKARRKKRRKRGKLPPLLVLRERAGVRVISSTSAHYFQITLTPSLCRSTGKRG